MYIYIYTAKHDKAMRAVSQAFRKGKHGSFYLIADVAMKDGLRALGVHSKRRPSFILSDAFG